MLCARARSRGGHVAPLIAAVADGLAERDIATLRYQFPYMEGGGKRPDTPKVAQATVRAAVAEASRLLPGLAVLAGGKSFGGRMTSQAQAASPLLGVQGLTFLGFPLHAAGRPSDAHGAHLFEIKVPMLFLQGTRDALAATELIEALVRRLGDRASLKLFQDADHSFHVPARSGRTDAEVKSEMLDELAAWLEAVVLNLAESLTSPLEAATPCRSHPVSSPSRCWLSPDRRARGLGWSI